MQSSTEAIEVADVILTHAPRDVWAILKKGTAYGHLIRTEFEDPYPHPFLIPMPQRLAAPGGPAGLGHPSIGASSGEVELPPPSRFCSTPSARAM